MRSPILAPSGGIKGSTAIWSSVEAHKTWAEDWYQKEYLNKNLLDQS